MFKKISAVVFVFVLLSANLLAAQGNEIWQSIDESQLRVNSSDRFIVPEAYSVFKLNKKGLDEILAKAPQEFIGAGLDNEIILSLPMPEGGLSRFSIKSSSIMEPGLAAKYPEIQSYTGQGIDDRAATVRFDTSPFGFRAMILSSEGTMLIEPYAIGNTADYISFFKRDVAKDDSFECLVGNSGILMNEAEKQFEFFGGPEMVVNGTTLRTYRLALAATAEYTTVFRQAGDTDTQAKARALAAMNTTMNRVNQVYERDLSIRMILVANTDMLIYTDAATDPYTNTSGSTMLGQNQTNIDTVIGTANYDIGHVFSTGGGGVASLNVPCNPASKARGVTGQSNPQGDPFDIDYVAHEMGHQFGGLHTFNGATGNCAGGNRSASAAYETGSGITIMAYAGICGAQDLARNSIDTFHVKSLEQIVAFSTNTGTCSVNTPNGNTPPNVPSAGTSYNIPKQTPFALTATTTDLNNDAVTYDWQQYDLGASTTAVPNTDSDGVAKPITRPFLPSASGTRYFPALQYILANANIPPPTYACGRTTPCLTGETLPAIARTMNFQVVARDNRAGGGGINTSSVQVIVDAASGPFNVTAPNTNVSWAGGSAQSVTWSVANTTNAPVSAASVRILLSTDGGQSFPIILSNSTPNDGSETVTLPNTASSTARIKVEGEGKIFFDISDANFTISSSAPARKPYDFDGDGKDDVSVYRGGIWYLNRSQAGFTGIQFGAATDKTVAADYDGDGKSDLAVFRDGNWFWLSSLNGSFNAYAFGAAGDIPMPGDYDGDGKADYTVFRNGIWYIFQSGNSQFRSEQFGIASDKPVSGDFDGDGKRDLAVFRNGNWFINRSQLGFTAIQFGIAGDLVAPADFDGDGKTDVAVYRGNIWYLQRSQLGFASSQFGIAGDVPVPADYDGDGKADIAVFRNSNGTWYLDQSQAGFTGIQFGANGDRAIPAQSN